MNITRSMDLSGKWRFKTDPEQTTDPQLQCHGLGSSVDIRDIDIGCPWEYWVPEYDGIAWYEKRFTLPPEYKECSLMVQFDAVSYYCECWLNGNYLGSHEGGFTPFTLHLYNHCQFDVENILVVRVINPPSDRMIEGFRSGAPLNQSDIPIGKAAWYYNFGGIWQGARILAQPACAISALRIFPDLHTNRLIADVTVNCTGTPMQAQLCLSVRKPDGNTTYASSVHPLNISSAQAVHRFEMPMHDLEKWDTDHPVLYQMHADIQTGATTVHTTSQTFGIREFTISGEHFLLNGQPVFLNGFLHQGCWPRTLAIPETREFALEELKEVKRRGFNFVRITMKPAPTWYLEMADQLGLLIMHEPPIGWIANGPQTRERCLRETRELITRDANHPSVVIIGLFNESFHLLGFTPEEVLHLTGEMATVARNIDPSRLIIDTSGGFSRKVLSGPDTMIHDSAADGYQFSRAMLPWQTDFIEIVDIHKYCRFPAIDAAVESYRTLPGHSQLMFIAEYGAPETPPDFDSVIQQFRPDEAQRQLEDWKLHRDFGASLRQRFEQSGLQQVIPSVTEFIGAIGRSSADENRRIAHAIRCNPHVSGMCFCQLSDASGELFGATDIWRRPKPLYDALTSASANPAIGLHTPKRVLTEREFLSLRATLTANPGVTYSGQAAISIAASSGEAIWFDSMKIHPRSGIMDILDTVIKTPLPSGTWKAKATFSDTSGKQNTHELEFRVLPATPARPRKIALRDADGRMEKYMRQAGWTVDTFGNNYRDQCTPVLLNVEAVPKNRGFYAELYGQLSKIVQLGGCAILFEPEVQTLYQWLFPHYIKPQAVMRTCPYALPHPVFSNITDGGVADYLFADVFPGKWDRGEDVLAAGGEVLFGAFSMHMWTRPAAYFWGAALYRIPIGKGNVIVCHLPLADSIAHSPVAVHLLHNLVDYATSIIVPGGEEYLMGRCIDPLSPTSL